MRIRDATPSDAAAIEAVRIAGWQAAYADLLPAEVLAGLWLDPERVSARAQWMSGPGQVSVVAETGGDVVGAACLVDLDVQTVELKLLYVLPDHWGSGLGHDLLEAGFARRPQPLQVLWVLEGNARARRFYERHGFAPDGATQVRDLGPDVVEVRYRREDTGT